MTTERRWMASLIAASAACKVRMPWERGLRRQAMIARRASIPRGPSHQPTLRETRRSA
jgi:hypothetical protein